MTRLLASFVIGLFAAGPVLAQATYTWTGGDGNGNWNVPNNWGGTLPLSGPAARIALAGTTQTTTNQNLGNPFALNRLTFAVGAGSFSVSGNPLQFQGDAAAVVLDSANLATINSGLVLDANLTILGGANAAGDPGGDLRLDGPISGNGGLRLNFSEPSAVASVRGTGNAFTGSVMVNSGALAIAGSGSISPAGPLFVGHSGTFVLDNTATNIADRLSNTATVRLGGGFQTVFGNDTAASTESAGALTLASGQSGIDLFPGASAGVQLTFASLSSAGTGTVLFNATGNNLGVAPGNGVANVLFTAAPSLVGGGGSAGTTTVSILPPALATNGPSGDAVTLVTYGANGIRPLTASEFASTLTAGTTTDNVRLTAPSVSVIANTTRNSLVLANSSFLTIAPGSTLSLTSGALLSLGNDTLVSGAGTLAFGNRAYVTVEGGNQRLTIENPITVTGNGGVVKSGSGTLVLENTAALSGNSVFVNSGTLMVEGAAPLASSPIIQVSGGATLDVTSLGATGLTLGSGQSLSGGGTVSGAVRVGNGSRIDPTSGDETGPGTLTTGDTTFQPGGIYAWRLNSVEGGAFTHSLLTSAGSLDLSGLSSGNWFTIQIISLTPENASGSLGDFNNSASYAWTLATYSGGITAFSADKFTIDTSAFANSLGGGSFVIGQNGNNLIISFTPVPEPGMVLAVAGTGALLSLRARRRRESQRQT
jgi:hypothetical protein